VTDYRYYKTVHSPRTAAEVALGALPVRAWQFHPQFDLGRWLGQWTRGHVGSGFDTVGTFTLFDDPRAARAAGQMNYDQNVSLDPLDSGNHVMEAVSFRGGIGVYIQAPGGQTAGPATLDFDYYFADWTCTSADHGNVCGQAPVRLTGWVWGVTQEQLPDWPDRTMGMDADMVNAILHDGSSGTLPYTLLFESHRWNTFGPSNDPQVTTQPVEPLEWRTLSDDYAGEFDLDQTFPYYFVQLQMNVFSEQDPKWFTGDLPTDSFSLAVDNVDFRMSLIPEPGVVGMILVAAGAGALGRRRR
jgi:hypothetical protein